MDKCVFHAYKSWFELDLMFQAFYFDMLQFDGINKAHTK